MIIEELSIDKTMLKSKKGSQNLKLDDRRAARSCSVTSRWRCTAYLPTSHRPSATSKVHRTNDRFDT